MSIVELTSAALARYLCNSSLRPAIMSGSLNNLTPFQLSVSDAVGLISKTFEGENNLLALTTFSRYAAITTKFIIGVINARLNTTESISFPLVLNNGITLRKTLNNRF